MTRCRSLIFRRRSLSSQHCRVCRGAESMSPAASGHAFVDIAAPTRCLGCIALLNCCPLLSVRVLQQRRSGYLGSLCTGLALPARLKVDSAAG